MALQTEEKETHDASRGAEHDLDGVTRSGGSTEHIQYPEIDELSERKEGMRIAGEALARDVMRYSGQAFVVFALVAIIVALGFWGVSQLHFLPGLMSEIARPFLPAPEAPKAGPASKPVESKTEKSDKPHLAQAPRHHRKARPKAPPPAYDYRRGGSRFSDNPSGGQIIYQDSMITEYRWNK